MNELYVEQINELGKLSYTFYRSLALGEEPLTYSFKRQRDEKDDTQVEVNAKIIDEDKVLIHIDFDTNWEGRWKHTKDLRSYVLTQNNVWAESSYDGIV